MSVQRFQLRAPADLANAATFLYEIPVSGARKVTIGMRATNGNVLASVSFERQAMGGYDGWQTTGTDFILSGDTLTATLNNSVAPSTVAAGREATWSAGGAANAFGAMSFHSPRVRIQGTNGAAIITAFEVWATVIHDDVGAGGLA